METAESFVIGTDDKSEVEEVHNLPHGNQLGLSACPVADKHQSFRVAMEKQKSFRGFMERQLSFIGGSDKKKPKDSPGKRGDSLLHLAARAGNVGRIKETLLTSSKDLLVVQNLDGETPLYAAAENGQAGAVAAMLECMDVQSVTIAARNGFTPFHVAARQGHVEVLKEMLCTYPNCAMTTDLSCTTALHTAATIGHIDVVNLLLESNSELIKIARNNGKTALHSAARMGHLEVVRSLVSKDPAAGFRIDKKGQSALHMAVKTQIPEIVEELLKPNLSIVNLEDNKGNTPLHVAAKKGHTKNVQLLLSVEGININPINRDGETPLDLVEKLGPSEVLSTLKEARALNAKELGKTPSAVKQLKQTVSDIKHDVQSQLQQTCQTGARVQKIAKRLKKLHISGLNNAINSATVVAVLIATVAFAAIFTVPGQYVYEKQDGASIGQAHIAPNPAFLAFFVFDSVALFISLAVVVVQTSVVVIEQTAKRQLVFVINKLMWVACLAISIAFVSLSYIVVGTSAMWLAVYATVVGGAIMLTTIGAMCYCAIIHRMESQANSTRIAGSRSRSYSMSVASDSDLMNGEFKRIYAL